MLSATIIPHFGSAKSKILIRKNSTFFASWDGLDRLCRTTGYCYE